MVETADRLSEADAGLQQYLLLVGALRSLARGEHVTSATLDSYLLRAMSIAGWAPSFRDCAVTGEPGPHSAFVVQLGGVVADHAAPPGTPRLDPDTLQLLGSLLAGDWGTVDASDERTRSRASGVVAAYAQWHLERSLRSLPHVDRTEHPSPVHPTPGGVPAAVAATPAPTLPEPPDPSGNATGNATDHAPGNTPGNASDHAPDQPSDHGGTPA
jgi:DNA repair protein RecO (recombination protein O)